MWIKQYWSLEDIARCCDLGQEADVFYQQHSNYIKSLQYIYRVSMRVSGPSGWEPVEWADTIVLQY
jgi:hypothetical protein